ncbi:hypothetical protein V1T76_23520 [Roseibium sp. FZY0029]|uniref:hypothetical protein n=1 Tax=Roseibium sp. FZY0029 TaxID=3116647 RepID=UPI002EB84E22|nr:hypothetical protein [Roseibium sp. FZY0029]
MHITAIHESANAIHERVQVTRLLPVEKGTAVEDFLRAECQRNDSDYPYLCEIMSNWCQARAQVL